jgi:hypothetical protein
MLSEAPSKRGHVVLYIFIQTRGLARREEKAPLKSSTSCSCGEPLTRPTLTAETNTPTTHNTQPAARQRNQHGI